MIAAEDLKLMRDAIDTLILEHRSHSEILQTLKATIEAALRPPNQETTDTRLSSEPRIDQQMLCVYHDGKCCFLGNTLPFKILARLMRTPGIYVPHNVLLKELWEGVRSDSAIRSVIKTLRIKLRKAGLNAVADRIDGSVRCHYSFRCHR
ncbi:winged helix-turn-helix domain-containing protein [Aureliella helgolandensis]|uniref:OmpR/PhoB-type domain-containing protein n=1 Tax=Aureliella helgolandensis TaxID=2527968 RepID=A0A518GB94_9BACT|nr:winged helix-turn-helix domain-containing protein [Aureliella helgolandensis]QDV25891.1 hypothetical protein Q31a_42190 [Aureliella helgolandensis]